MAKRDFPSYGKMIKESIINSKKGKLTLKEIYEFMKKKYPKIVLRKGWKNAIRHNLSLNSNFYKIPRSAKGCYWGVNISQKKIKDNSIEFSEILCKPTEIIFTGRLKYMEDEFIKNYEEEYSDE